MKWNSKGNRCLR